MIIGNNQRTVIIDGEESGQVEMNISASREVQDHLISLLTDRGYRNKRESTARETFCNAWDSHVAAGCPDKPIPVRLYRENGKWVFSVEDQGIGLSEEDFDRYIMNIGESTKRQSNDFIGAMGAGAKSPLSYTNAFQMVCRKDGVERTFLIYKGDKRPQKSKLTEVPTDQPNGVLVKVYLNDQWNEVAQFKQAIKQQLCYFPTALLLFEEDSTDYTKSKIFRHPLFEWSELYPSKEMHLSLAGVNYPIDWEGIELDRINVPVAVRIGLDEGVSPIFNREELIWSEETKALVRERIRQVAEHFRDRFNESIKEFDNLSAAWDYIDIPHKVVHLEGNPVVIDSLLEATGLTVDDIKVKGIKEKSPGWYKKNSHLFFYEYEVVGVTGYNKWHRWIADQLERSTVIHNKVIEINTAPVGNFRQYLFETVGSNTYFVVKRRQFTLRKRPGISGHTYYSALGLEKVPKEKWRAVIREFQAVRETMLAAHPIMDGRDWTNSPEYTEWLEAKREEERQRRGLSRYSSNYLPLNKQKGEISVHTARKRLWAEEITFDKGKLAISELDKRKSLTVYFTEKELTPQTRRFILFALAALPKVNFVKVNVPELKYITQAKHWCTMAQLLNGHKRSKDQHMFSQPLKRYITANLIRQYLTAIPVYNVNIIYDMFPAFKEMQKRLEAYATEHYVQGAEKLFYELRETAGKNGLYDESIYSELVQFKEIIDKFGFLNYLQDLDGYFSNPAKKAVIRNIVYIMLKHRKVSGRNVDDFELVPKPGAVPESEEAKPYRVGFYLSDTDKQDEVFLYFDTEAETLTAYREKQREGVETWWEQLDGDEYENKASFDPAYDTPDEDEDEEEEDHLLDDVEEIDSSDEDEEDTDEPDDTDPEVLAEVYQQDLEDEDDPIPDEEYEQETEEEAKAQQEDDDDEDDEPATFGIPDELMADRALSDEQAHELDTLMADEEVGPCILTGEPGENEEDCTTHDHEPVYAEPPQELHTPAVVVVMPQPARVALPVITVQAEEPVIQLDHNGTVA